MTGASLCSLMVLKIAILNIAGGLIYGYAIGYVGPYSTIFKTSQNCTLFKSELACSTLTHANCRWNVSTEIESSCVFDYDCSILYDRDDKAACNADAKCTFDDKLGKCTDAVGMDAAQLGIFAGAPTVGGCIAALTAGLVISFLGVRKTLIFYGLVALIGSIMAHISLPVNNYWVLAVGRFLVGLATGVVCVACPMYCDAASPTEVRNQVGMLFQIATTSGIVFAALVGLFVDPDSMGSAYTSNMVFDVRLQIINGISTLTAVLIMLAALFVPGHFGRRRGLEEVDIEQQSLVGDSKIAKSYSWFSMAKPLAVAVVLSAAQQLTGINAIMSYAPIITSAMGLKPLVGNLLVMVWNFVTSFGSVFIAARMQLRTMFLVGASIGSVACLVTGIPVLPPVTTESVRTVLAGLGVFLFILMFEFFMGSSYFVLSQQLFPAEFRGKGASWTLGVQFLFAIAINVCFPIAQTSLSGGPGADQNLGLGIIFIFFGSTGLVSTIVLFRYLRIFEDSNERKS